MIDSVKALYDTMDTVIKEVKTLREDVEKLKKIHARKTGIKNSR